MSKSKKNPYFGKNLPCFFICEIGINHNGSIKRAKKMIDLAVKAGADAVKFQMRHLDSLYQADVLDNLENQDLGLQQSIDFINNSQLTDVEFVDLAKYCKKKKILFLCTPWDLESLKVLEKIGVKLYKVASADISNIPLINAIIKTKKPMIISTGMSTHSEIKKTYEYLTSKKANFSLLHCNSTYPADFKDINLKFMQRMMEQYNVPIGYSGHERGVSVSIAACALGAKIIERHFTLDRNMSGPDHQASLEPGELTNLISGIREAELALGKTRKELSQGIIINKETLGKSLIAATRIPIGTTITKSMVISRSPGTGLSPTYLDELIGTKSRRNISKNEFFTPQDIRKKQDVSFSGSFNRKWGIPVRFHDMEKMRKMFNPDFVEIHLSYKDVLEPVFPNKLKSKPSYKIHVPEIWPDGFILDLASAHKSTRKKSINYVKKTVETIHNFALKNNLTTKNIDFILHVGGHSNSTPVTNKKIISEMYDNLAKSFTQLKNDHPDTKFLPENMPPLPWLLGGQRFHNIFTKASSILEFCDKLDLKICLDISHAYLYCQYSINDFYEYVSLLLPITSHLHLADARGTDGEGLKIGNGEIEFDRLKKIIDSHNKKATFITEIWQGHQRKGEGFHLSLTKLSQLGY